MANNVFRTVEPELEIIVTKVDPVVIEKSGENATIHLLILHTPRSSYTAFLVNFKLTLPDIYEFIPDTVFAHIDNETVDGMSVHCNQYWTNALQYTLMAAICLCREAT